MPTPSTLPYRVEVPNVNQKDVLQSAYTGINYDPHKDYQIQSAEQFQTFYYIKKAMVEAAKDQYFTQLASTVEMPKHYGKKMRGYKYIPLLDDRNQNSQGIDASGQTIESGNLYGSSRDFGVIEGKLPLLGETGGRVNRVGITRVEYEGSFFQMGLFYEWTEDALMFDTDAELKNHIASELMKGASQLSEAILQMDLLAAAETGFTAGTGTKESETLTSLEDVKELTYSDLKLFARELDEQRVPTQTKIITGSSMTDTKTVGSKYIAYCGADLLPTLERMTDYFGNQAWVPVEKYGAATTLLRGEVGSIGDFKVIKVPEMLHWTNGAKASEAVANVFQTEAKKENEQTVNRMKVYPFLVVGADSFSTISFHSTNQGGKFKIITKVPGSATADSNDPYGKTGFYSMQWYYGFLCKRPERIGLLKCVARKI